MTQESKPIQPFGSENSYSTAEVRESTFKSQTIEDFLAARGLVAGNKFEDDDPGLFYPIETNGNGLTLLDREEEPNLFDNLEEPNTPEYQAEKFTTELIQLIMKKDKITQDKAAQLIGNKLNEAKLGYNINIKNLVDWQSYLDSETPDPVIDLLAIMATQYGMNKQIIDLRVDWLKNWGVIRQS